MCINDSRHEITESRNGRGQACLKLDRADAILTRGNGVTSQRDRLGNEDLTLEMEVQVMTERNERIKQCHEHVKAD